MDSEFALHLGQGWYVDVDGRFHSEPVTAAATYEQPGGLPFDAKAVKDAFNDVKGVLPDTDDPKSVAKFRDMGLPEETIKFLGAIGVAAGAAGTAMGIVAFLFAAAKFVGLFTDGDDALMKKVDAVFKELRAFSRSQGNEVRDKMIAEVISELTVALNSVKSYIDELKAYVNDDATQLELRRQELRAMETRAATTALRATSPLSWTRAFDVAEYTGSWFWLNGWLQVQPEAGPQMPYLLPPQADARQDSRIMVPVALYAAQSYLMTIRGITPEFRTTGEFRDNLASLANNLSALAANMRLQSLAKIIYKPEDFIYVPAEFPVGDANKITSMTHYTVGAVDLCSDTDAFVRTPPFSDQQWQDAWAGRGTLRRGQMEFYWLPSQTPYTYPVKGYEHPEAAVAEANAIAEQRYVELLLRSGYLQLSHQAALLRHLSTEPRKSETVTGEAGYALKELGARDVTAKSEQIPFAGVIESPAKLQRRSWSARTRVGTQPLGHQRMVDYRILLRSVPALDLGKYSEAPDYDRVYSATYENDPTRPGYKRLKVNFSVDDVIDEVELFRGKSPQDLKHSKGKSSLRVTSFDWYVREHSALSGVPSALIDAVRQSIDASDDAQPGHGSGFHAEPAPGPSTKAPGPVMTSVIHNRATVEVADAFDSVAWLASPSVRGERRHLRDEQVTVAWSFEWLEDRLRVVVDGSADDRNYVLHLVVEEQLISGQKLHTAFPLTMNNQITLVPQDFLDREQAAWDFAAKTVDFVSHHYAKSASHIRGKQLEVQVDPTALLSRPGIAELAETYERIAPELVEKATGKLPST